MVSVPPPGLRIVPASQASLEHLEQVFGAPGDQDECRCQWPRVSRAEWKASSQDEREAALRSQAACGQGEGAPSSGLLAYVDEAPAGWVAVEPRSVYLRLRAARLPWLGRDEDKDDDAIWAVPCFVVRPEFRGRGLMGELAAAAVAHARGEGAVAVEGYPVIPVPDARTPVGDLFVGTVGAFERAGMTEVSRPSPRRSVMRIDLAPMSG
ncbi:GNAT family N-acetyltransferase [Demequina salsinemoris]|uniref:GNAT family N-acetyltransferase n=1 Tax=Demequina salsinemoris TaxID=577470 RepID=UPI0007846887|nr:GNAT family N-acetyltransferase [Demequina salsinemoris]